MTRLEIYRSIEMLTEGEITHLRQHLASSRLQLDYLLMKEASLNRDGKVSPLFRNLQHAVIYGSHGDLALAMRTIYRWIGGK